MNKYFFCEKDVEEYILAHTETILNWKNKNHFYDRFIKRLLDFVFAVLLGVFFLPCFAVIAIVIKLTSPGPIFYRGIRCGYGGVTFRIFKFRTMVVNAEHIGGGTTALNDPRITRVGAFLRKTKLDETPQVLNILRGEMSFVGPRPELLQYTQEYRGAEKLILQVRPGITDVSSMTFISLDELVGGADADQNYERLVLKRKNLLRIGYVLYQSPLLDAKLFFMTVWQVTRKCAGVN